MKSYIKQNEQLKFETELYKLFQNYSKNCDSKIGFSLKNFNENLFFYKVSKKLLQCPNQNEESSVVITNNFLKCLKSYFVIKSIQSRFINENSNDLEFLTKELIIYNIFKELEDVNSKNGMLVIDAILFFNMLLYEYIPEILIFSKDKSENQFIEMFIEEKEKEKINMINFAIFEKMLKTTLTFLIYVDKYKNIIDSLDFEGKNKILTAELVVCLNKIYRILNEQDRQILRIKHLTEIIDISKVYMKKSDFFKLVIYIFINKNE